MVWYNIQIKEKMAILPFIREAGPEEDTERTQRRNDNVPVATLEKQTGPVEEGEVSLERFRETYTYLAAKRIFDILVAGLGGLVLAIPMAVIAAMIWLESPGPAIYKQERVGKDGKPFMMYKFRSMRVNDRETSGWSTNQDPRKTKFGAFIRKCSIDELPQFFNVLRGDMSLVGPRPELPHFVEQFKESIPLYMVKHQVRPGITGWAQVNGYRGDTSIEERIRHDIFYIENWSPLLDIRILLMTVFKVFNSEKLV